MEWIHIEDKIPENDQMVWYYFAHTGISLGKFKRELVDKEWQREVFGTAEEWYTNTFYGDGGWLSDEVTHWMPYTKGMNEPSMPTKDLDLCYSVYSINGEYILIKNAEQNQRNFALEDRLINIADGLIPETAEYKLTIKNRTEQQAKDAFERWRLHAQR